MEIRKDNIYIRTAVPEDAEDLLRWWNDGQVMAHAGFPNGLNTNKEKILSQIHQSPEFVELFMIEIDHIPVGEMSYRRLPENQAEIGIKICEREYQNKGYGKKILSLLIAWLFEEKKFSLVVLDTNLSNKRAQHTYESLGFQKKGVRLDCWQDQNGVYQSAVDYELKKENFCNRVSCGSD